MDYVQCFSFSLCGDAHLLSYFAYFPYNCLSLDAFWVAPCTAFARLWSLLTVLHCVYVFIYVLTINRMAGVVDKQVALSRAVVLYCNGICDPNWRATN
jgi:hypothetical protein